MLKKGSIPPRLLLFLKGMAMGAADTVPGVSGGTIAFVTNIYEELIYSIRQCNVQAVKLLGQEGLRSAWQYINGNFLLTLFLGILTSAFSLARGVSYLLANFEAQVMAFFMGLILASSLFVRKQIKGWDAARIILLLVGILFAVMINLLPERTGNASSWFIFLSGAIAICAMILPGISGAFILILLGAYGTVIEAVSEFNLGTLLLFAGGCIVGLLSFSRLLAFLLKHYHGHTLAVLLGIMLGSVYGLWPQEFITQPVSLSTWTLFAVLTMIGFVVVYGLEVISKRPA